MSIHYHSSQKILAPSGRLNRDVANQQQDEVMGDDLEDHDLVGIVMFISSIF